MNIKEICTAPPVREMRTRLDSLQAAMGEQGLTGYVSFAPANIMWLTNFANFVHERPFILFVPQSGTPMFLVPRLELDHATSRVIGEIEYATYAEFPAPIGQGWNDRLETMLEGHGPIGVETTVPLMVQHVVGDHAVPVDLIDRLREIKSDYELGRIAYACRLKSEAHAELLRQARPGLSQSEINRTIGKSVFEQLAADNPTINPFATTIMTLIQNPGVSHDPHNFSDLDMKMQAGGPHVTVFNSVLNGYGAEIERTFFLGHVPEQAKAPFDAMVEARRMAFEHLRSGAVLGEIDRRINTMFRKRGFEEARRHRAGHGMGVTAHEGPFIADGDEGVVKPGMVFTIEPGLYIPGLGGFRHSDTVVVADDGLISLTHGPEHIDELTL